MSQNDFDLSGTEQFFENGRDFDPQKHYDKGIEMLGSETFDIYKAIKKEDLDKDILPFSGEGHEEINGKPATCEDVIQMYIKAGYSLLEIAWKHANFSFNSNPTLSWSTHEEVARAEAKKRAEDEKIEYVVVKAQGVLMSPDIKRYQELMPNFVVYIPALAEMNGHWPTPESENEFEAVTFGIFPHVDYQVVD